MAEAKNNLIIKFGGRLDSLYIKHEGKVILDYKGKPEEPKKESANVVKSKGKMAAASSFAKAVYSISILRDIWRKSYFKKSLKVRFHFNPGQRRRAGKANIFNKIVAANRKVTIDEHPTIHNMLVPNKFNGLNILKASVNNNGIHISYSRIYDFPIDSNDDSKLTAAMVLCAYEPKRKLNKKFELIAKDQELKDKNNLEWNNITLPLREEEAELIASYKSIIIYFAVVYTTANGLIINWISAFPFEMTNKGESTTLKKERISVSA
jgi:hypothetical protein